MLGNRYDGRIVYPISGKLQMVDDELTSQRLRYRAANTPGYRPSNRSRLAGHISPFCHHIRPHK
jgi:hypothetical protein